MVKGSPPGIVAIAASLGGVAALRDLLGTLPASFPWPILVCQHVGRRSLSLLPGILARRTGLRVAAAVEGIVPMPGSVHVAPSGQHLLARADGRLGLSDKAPENFCRPSADVLFRSVAETYGDRAIAVVLTGRGRDGARGVEAIRQRGGFAIAQDETSSEAFEMPLAARDIGQADLVMPLRQIADALQVLVRDGSDTEDAAPAGNIRRAGAEPVPPFRFDTLPFR